MAYEEKDLFVCCIFSTHNKAHNDVTQLDDRPLTASSTLKLLMIRFAVLAGIANDYCDSQGG